MNEWNLFQEHCIPQAVADQLHLWEEEINRISYAEGALYNQFNSDSDFEYIREYAKVCSFVRFLLENAVFEIKRYYLCLCYIVDYNMLLFKNGLIN